jgi:hypothetical protein
MFGFFAKKQLLSDESVQWLFDTFAWSLGNFGSDIFYNETILVVPSNELFPGRVESVHGMATLIFEQVKAYAGMKHWPCRLVDQNVCSSVESPRVQIAGALRGSKGIIPEQVDERDSLIISYHPDQINDPEGMIASYAHILAHYLGTMAEEPPPVDKEYWPHATELLAIFMGFGVMFANSAFTFKGGCGSCKGPAVERSAFLSQDEATYALAIFAQLKAIPEQEVLRYLKRHLRPVYRQAVKDIRARTEELERIETISQSVA